MVARAVIGTGACAMPSSSKWESAGEASTTGEIALLMRSVLRPGREGEAPDLLGGTRPRVLREAFGKQLEARSDGLASKVDGSRVELVDGASIGRRLLDRDERERGRLFALFERAKGRHVEAVLVVVAISLHRTDERGLAGVLAALEV